MSVLSELLGFVMRDDDAVFRIVVVVAPDGNEARLERIWSPQAGRDAINDNPDLPVIVVSPDGPPLVFSGAYPVRVIPPQRAR